MGSQSYFIEGKFPPFEVELDLNQVDTSKPVNVFYRINTINSATDCNHADGSGRLRVMYNGEILTEQFNLFSQIANGIVQPFTQQNSGNLVLNLKGFVGLIVFSFTFSPCLGGTFGNVQSKWRANGSITWTDKIIDSFKSVEIANPETMITTETIRDEFIPEILPSPQSPQKSISPILPIAILLAVGG